MSSLVLTVRETLRYRGSIGQWSWVLHRATGLGVVFFLVLHVIDTSWSVFFPGLYEKAIAAYQSPLFTIGEFGLVFAVVYHALNGLRIAIMDNKPELWKYQERAAYGVLGVSALILVPMFLGMGVAIVVAIILSGLYGMVSGAPKVSGSAKSNGSQLERFWWSFMRVSGLLILPLVFGHLAMLHILQGVFDLSLAGSPVVGVVAEGDALQVPSLEEAMTNESAAAERATAFSDFSAIQNGINDSGTATEFVGERWNFLVGGVAVWKLYDIALLALVTIHGFNGLRYVLTDYTQDYPILRRAMGYVCVIGAVCLLVVGGAALLGTIQPEAVKIADEAMRAIRSAHGMG